jgi:hypothetical protein
LVVQRDYCPSFTRHPSLSSGKSDKLLQVVDKGRAWIFILAATTVKPPKTVSVQLAMPSYAVALIVEHESKKIVREKKNENGQEQQ